jgi:hypothetical protein
MMLKVAQRMLRYSASPVLAARALSTVADSVVHDTSPFINQRDLLFMANEFIDCKSVLQMPRYAHHDSDTVTGVINSAVDLAAAEFYPLYQVKCVS